MTDLRKAAEMALDAFESLDCGDTYKTHNAASVLRQALAQPEQEPVAWMGVDSYGNVTKFRTNEFGGGIPLYTAPPKRTWVGLSDEEIYDYADKFLYSHGSNYGIRSFGKAIEARLKEKNSG